MAELVFDTRDNYQKIYLDDSVTLSVANPNTSTSTTISHNLGYHPNVRVWFTTASGYISTAVSDAAASALNFLNSEYTNRACHYKTTTTGLVLTLYRGVTVGTTRTATIYYRIYLDGQ